MSFGQAFADAIKAGATLEIKSKGYLEFDETDKLVYAAIGAFISDIASLEFLLDEFIFSIVEHHPKIAKRINPTGKLQVKDKIEFLIYAHVCVPILRSCGDADGRLDLQYIYYGLLELFDQRNGVVHGKIIFTDIKDENFKLKVEKYVKIAKKSYTLQHIEYGSGFLRNGLRDAHYFRGIVGTAKALITGEFDPVANREEMMKGHIKWQRTTEGLRNMGYIVEE